MSLSRCAVWTVAEMPGREAVRDVIVDAGMNGYRFMAPILTTLSIFIQAVFNLQHSVYTL